ncbi:MAG: acetylornithine deacetylase [Amylibacter sp.]|nr:acetylornithine deacetylase [Amylibacter sp.]
MNRLTETIDVLDRLIGFPTISSDSNMACITYLQDFLTSLGARCTLTSQVAGKANLFATLGPEGDGGIILSGHTDVVPVEGQNWSSDPFTMRKEDGRLYGRGTCDMKGFIAASIVTARDYAKRDLKRPIHFAFTYDEEVGCLGGRILVDQLIKDGLKPSACIVGEPTSMRIIDGHKGCCEYTTEFTGVEGHSSLPHLSVNALEYATRFITHLMQVREDLPALAPENTAFDPPYSTSSICALHSGVAHNVIPNKALVEWEMRVIQQSDHVYLRGAMQDFVDTVLLPEMRAKSPKANIEEVFSCEVAGLEPEEDSEAVQVIRELTGRNATGVVSFGTEAGLYKRAGISAALCGPGSIEQAHKPDEYVEVSQLDECLKMLDRLAGKLV